MSDKSPQEAEREGAIRRGAKERGLRIYTMFRDGNGTLVRVQSSSDAERRCVWIFSSNHKHDDMAPHLTMAQARRVRDALDRFIRGVR